MRTPRDLRGTASGPQPPPAKRPRLSIEGKIKKWTIGKNYGFAVFDGFGDQQIFVHSKDVEGTLPSVGDCVEATVCRRDDGKLRAYEVIARPDPEKVHATLMGMS